MDDSIGVGPRAEALAAAVREEANAATRFWDDERRRRSDRRLAAVHGVRVAGREGWVRAMGRRRGGRRVVRGSRVDPGRRGRRRRFRIRVPRSSRTRIWRKHSRGRRARRDDARVVPRAGRATHPPRATRFSTPSPIHSPSSTPRSRPPRGPEAPIAPARAGGSDTGTATRRAAVESGPPAKIATLAPETCSAVEDVWNELERRRDDTTNSVGADDAGAESSRIRRAGRAAALSTRVRAGRDARIAGEVSAEGRTMIVVAEGAGGTLLEASAAARKFADTHFEGVFDDT